MCKLTSLSHIVDEYILPAGMRVWVVCTRTRLPHMYMIMTICVPRGSKYDFIPVSLLGKTHMLRLDVDIEGLGIELTSIPNQSSIGIRLQYQNHCFDAIDGWNRRI
jgi:hypothetical protein